MAGLCEIYDELPAKAREAILRIAAYTYLKSLVDNGKYDAALRFLIGYGSRFMSVTDLEKYEAFLKLEAAYKHALNIARAVLSDLEEKIIPPEPEIDAAVKAARELLEAAENAILPRDIREKARQFAWLLMDTRVAAEALKVAKPLISRLNNALRGILERVTNIFNTVSESLRRNDYNMFQDAVNKFHALIEDVRRLLGEVDSAIHRLKEIESQAKTDDIKRYIESFVKTLDEYRRIVSDALKIISYYVSVSGIVFNGVREIEDFVNRVKNGENPLKLLDEFTRGVGSILDAINTALRYIRALNTMPMDEVEERVLGRLRNATISALESIVEAMEKLYEDLRQMAAHNDDLWNAFKSISEAYGVHPTRPERPWWETIQDFINTWLQRFSFEADIYAKLADQANNILDKLKWGTLAFLSYFAKHTVSAVEAIPAVVVKGLETLGNIMLDIVTNNIAKLATDVVERAQFLGDVLKSFIPRFKNPIDAAAWIASMAALGALLDSFGVRMPRVVAELPIVGRIARLVVGEKITPMSIIDIAMPEVGILFRGSGMLLKTGLERLARLLRRAAERGLEPMEVELREKVGEVEIEGEAIGEFIKNLEDRLVDILSRRVGREAAVRIAKEVVDSLKREISGRSEVSLLDIMRALENASIRDVDLIVDVVRGLARFRSAADLLRSSIKDITKLLERSEEARLEEVVKTLTNVERKVREVQETAAWVLEHLDDIRRLFGDKAAERLEAVARRLLEELSPEALRKAREVVQAASGLLGKLEEMKKALASAVERLFGDKEVAEMILKAETPWDAIRAALKALERHPGALKAYEELARLIEEEWKSVLPYYSRLAMLLGSSIRYELTRELSEAAAKRIVLEVEQLPKELQAVIREIFGNKKEVTLEELVRALDEMPTVLKDQPLAVLELVEEALRRSEPLIKRLEKIAAEYRNEKLAEELRAAYQKALTWIEERRARILQLYAPLIRTFDELAELFRREGLEDLARLAREARDALPRTDEFIAKLEELAKELDRVKNPRLINRIGRLLVRLKKMLGPKEWKLLEPFAEHIAELARELGVAAGGLAGFEIRVGRYKAKAMLATSKEAAEAMAEIIEKGTWKKTVRVDGLEVEVERRVELRPNETVIEYRARGPGGYWEVRRIVIRVTCKLGRCYADVFEGRAWDPRLTEEAVALLDYAISKAMEEDPLKMIGDKVLVLMEHGSTRLADILSEIAEKLRSAGEPVARMLESLHILALNVPLPALGYALKYAGETVRIAGYIREVRLLPNGALEITYIAPTGERASIVISDGNVEWRGNPHILINALRNDEDTLDLITRLVPQEDISSVIVRIHIDGKVIDTIPPEMLLRVIRILVTSQPIYINIKTGKIAFSIPSFKLKTTSGNITITVASPKQITITVPKPSTTQQPTPQPSQQPPPKPPVEVNESPKPRYPIPVWVTSATYTTTVAPLKAGRRVVEALVL